MASRKNTDPNAKTKFHLNIDRETELLVIQKAHKKESKRPLVPVRVNAKTIIFIEKGRDKKKAVDDFLSKLDRDDKVINRSSAIKPKPETPKKREALIRGNYKTKNRSEK